MTKSDKLKKKMAMIAREREEFELQKLAMKEDLDYVANRDKEDSIKKNMTSDDGDNPPTVRRTISKGNKRDDSMNIKKHATADEGDHTSSSLKRVASNNAGRRYSMGSTHSHGKLATGIGRSISNSDISAASNGSPKPYPIPACKKISDWCYTSPPDSTPPILKGHQDLYVEVRFLGRGAFGTVDLIKNKEDNKLYAVKTMLVKSKDQQTAFLHEVKYLRNRHPFIIHLHDVFITTNPKKVYLVMHYCEGGDLGKVISAAVKNKLPILETQIYKWLIQICLAIDFLHDLRIVHRDIKPQNILLSDSGEVAQLADFGLATQLTDTEEHFKSCEVGTPFYTAPEMINAQPCSFPVDLWSLGVVLFELLALDLPFDGVDTLSLVKSVLNEDYKAHLIPPSTYCPDLTSLVDGLLCKDPVQRMTTVQLLNSPGVATRAAQQPSQYRPKYLEERLKRAHVKQMTRQLEQLGVHCPATNSSASSFSSTPKSELRSFSPLNSARQKLNSLSPTNKSCSTKSCVSSSTLLDDPVLALDKSASKRPFPNDGSGLLDVIDDKAKSFSANDTKLQNDQTSEVGTKMKLEEEDDAKLSCNIKVQKSQASEDTVKLKSESEQSTDLIEDNKLQKCSISEDGVKLKAEHEDSAKLNIRNTLQKDPISDDGVKLKTERQHSASLKNYNNFPKDSMSDDGVKLENGLDNVPKQDSSSSLPPSSTLPVAVEESSTHEVSLDSINNEAKGKSRDDVNADGAKLESCERDQKDKSIPIKEDELSKKTEHVADTDTAQLKEDKCTRIEDSVNLPPIAISRSGGSADSDDVRTKKKNRKHSDTLVVNLPELPTSSKLVTVTSPLSRKGKNHTRRHSAHPLERTRGDVSKESILSNNRRRCKSGTTRVVDVVFLPTEDGRGNSAGAAQQQTEKKLIPFK